MAFDIQAAKQSGYSDEEIAQYLAKENQFDLDNALKSGYTSSDVVEFLSKNERLKPVQPEPEQPKTSLKDTALNIVKETAGTLPRGAIETIQTYVSEPLKAATDIVSQVTGLKKGGLFDETGKQLETARKFYETPLTNEYSDTARDLVIGMTVAGLARSASKVLPSVIKKGTELFASKAPEILTKGARATASSIGVGGATNMASGAVINEVMQRIDPLISQLPVSDNTKAAFRLAVPLGLSVASVAAWENKFARAMGDPQMLASLDEMVSKQKDIKNAAAQVKDWVLGNVKESKQVRESLPTRPLENQADTEQILAKKRELEITPEKQAQIIEQEKAKFPEAPQKESFSIQDRMRMMKAGGDVKNVVPEDILKLQKERLAKEAPVDPEAILKKKLVDMQNDYVTGIKEIDPTYPTMRQKGESGESYLTRLQTDYRRLKSQPKAEPVKVEPVVEEVPVPEKIPEQPPIQSELSGLTPKTRKADIDEAITNTRKEGFEPMGNRSLPVGDLKVGDSFYGEIQGVKDKYHVKGIDPKTGNTIIKDGKQFELDPFEQVRVEAIKDTGEVTPNWVHQIFSKDGFERLLKGEFKSGWFNKNEPWKENYDAPIIASKNIKGRELATDNLAVEGIENIPEDTMVYKNKYAFDNNAGVPLSELKGKTPEEANKVLFDAVKKAEQPETVAHPQAAKEPWEMTRDEFVKKRGANAPIESDDFARHHLSKVLKGESGLSVEGDKIIIRNENGEPIAVTTMRKAGGENVVDNTAVHPEYRRQGLATQLYQKAKELSYENGWVENAASATAKHKMAINQALSEGKPVPPEVLAEYPDLTATKADLQRGETVTDAVSAKTEAASALNDKNLYPWEVDDNIYPPGISGTTQRGYEVLFGDKYTPEVRARWAEDRIKDISNDLKRLHKTAATAPNSGAAFELRNNRSLKTQKIRDLKLQKLAWEKELATQKSQIKPVSEAPKAPTMADNVAGKAMGQPEPVSPDLAQETTAIRPIKDILTDINDSLGEKGAIGSWGKSSKQAEAQARLQQDFDNLKREARKAGITVADYMKRNGFDDASVSRMMSFQTGGVTPSQPQQTKTPLPEQIQPQISSEEYLKNKITQTPEQLPKYAGSINLNRQDILEEAKRMEMALFEEEGIPKTVESHKELAAKAEKVIDTFNKNPEFYNKRVAAIAKGQTPTRAEELAHRMINGQKQNEFIETAKKIGSGEATQDALEPLLNDLRTTQLKVTDPLASSAGRRLSSYNIVVGKNRAFKAMAELENKLNDRQLASLNKVNWDDPKSVDKFVKELDDPKLMDYVYEYWYNSILSGIPTHIVNVASNTGWMAFQLPHRALTSGVDAVISTLTGKQRTRYLNELVPMWAGMKKGLVRGRKAASEMMKTGEVPTEQDTKWAQEIGTAKGAWERSPNPTVRKIGKLLTVPTKGLQAMDVWANSIAYDAEIGAIARREANAKGLKGMERIKFEQDFAKNIPDSAHEEAMKFAKYATFNDEPGWIGTSILKARENIPGGRFLVPFVRTVGNLMKRGVEMTPGIGTLISKGQNPAEVIAKQIEGVGLAAYVWNKADVGEITGAPPESESERESFYRQGKLPWAVKVGDKYYSYRRMEPFNTVIASTMSLYDAFNRAKDDATKTDIILKAAGDIKNNLLDSGYMQGVAQLVNKYGKARDIPLKIASSLAVPMSGMGQSIAKAWEKAETGEVKVRERDWRNNFYTKMPGRSTKLPADKTVFGEDKIIEGSVFRQWLPYKYTTEKQDPTEKLLDKLKEYPAPPQQKVSYKGKQIKLDDEIYRDFTISYGKELKKQLDKYLSKPQVITAIDDERKKRVVKGDIDEIKTSLAYKYRQMAIKKQLQKENANARN